MDLYAENILLQKISQISGVGLVGVGGQQKPSIRVQVDPEALAARGINLEDLRTVLGQANVDLARVPSTARARPIPSTPMTNCSSPISMPTWSWPTATAHPSESATSDARHQRARERPDRWLG